MAELRKRLDLEKIPYYETHLSLVNCILPTRLTPMEIKVLAAFMSLEGDVAQYRFGTTGRKIVMNQLDLASAGLSNYIKSMLIKKFLIKKVDNQYEIWPILIPEAKEQMYVFKLVNKSNIELV